MDCRMQTGGSLRSLTSNARRGYAEAEPVADHRSHAHVPDKSPVVESREIELVGAVDTGNGLPPLLAKVIAVHDKRSTGKARDGDAALPFGTCT